MSRHHRDHDDCGGHECVVVCVALGLSCYGLGYLGWAWAVELVPGTPIIVALSVGWVFGGVTEHIR